MSYLYFVPDQRLEPPDPGPSQWSVYTREGRFVWDCGTYSTEEEAEQVRAALQAELTDDGEPTPYQYYVTEEAYEPEEE